MTNSLPEQRREHSKLEVDDPDYCKECGAEIPINDDSDWVARDSDGVYESYNGRGEFVRVEKCIDCWLDEELKEIRHDAEAIFSDGLPEVLRR